MCGGWWGHYQIFMYLYFMPLLCRKALEEIFEMSDLDDNGLLSREEFNWFNIRTSDEQVADDEWQVVEGNTCF